MTDSLPLLREARAWLRYGINTRRLDPTSDVPNVIERLDAAISSLEAAPERKCKSCKHWSEREEECWNPSGLVKTCGGEFGCIKWQPRSDHWRIRMH